MKKFFDDFKKNFLGTPGRAVASTVCIMLALLAVLGLIGAAVVRSGKSSGADTPSYSAEAPSSGADTPSYSAEAPFSGADTPSYSAESPSSGVESSSRPGEAGADDGRKPQEISLDEARKAALADAGLSEAEVTFTRGKLENDDGVRVYDIEFHTSGAEYDYEIDAYDGTVYEKETKTYAGGEYIGTDRAKEIALDHAGLQETDVRFAKTDLEYDDGKAEYEVEFYFGTTEYDYSIDAVSGEILEYDVDRD